MKIISDGKSLIINRGKAIECLRKKRIVPVEIVGMPASQPSAEAASAAFPLSGSVTVQPVTPIASVVISLSNGVQLSKNHLSYPEFLELVEKLEVLC